MTSTDAYWWLQQGGQAPPVPATLRPWRVEGRNLVTHDGQPALWIGTTAMALLDQVAHGREAEADAFCAWATETGFNVARVLAMEWPWVPGWISLRAEEGYEALPTLVDLTRRHGLHIELVALSSTGESAYNWSLDQITAHIRRLRDILGGLGTDSGVMVEGASEPWDVEQAKCLHDPAVLVNLETELAPLGLLTSQGTSQDDEDTGLPLGGYVVRHLDRFRDCWNMVRRVKELRDLSQRTGQYVVNDEPARPPFNDSDRPWTDESIAYTMGALGRVCSVGNTFHSTAGKYARVPTGLDLACANAFIRGTRLIAPDRRLRFENAGADWPNSPVAGANFVSPDNPDGTIIRAYSGVDDQGFVTVALGVNGDPAIRWRRPAQLYDAEVGVQVFTG